MRFRIPLMMMTVLAAGVLAAQDAPAPKPVNVGGVWEVTMQTPQGDMTADATFVQENDKFKFTMPGPQGMELAGEGTVKGQELEWAVLLSGGMGEMTLTYKAKVEGDTMTGEVQAGDFGAFPFTAKKKK
jgi:hypothetical protein